MSKKLNILVVSFAIFLINVYPGALYSKQNKDAQILKEMVELRRHLHMIPEPGNKEFETKAFILDYLEKINKEKRLKIIPILKTGIVAVLQGKKPGSIMFRADIDALPIEEKTGVSFQSRHKGFMHACGHDVHTAILLRTVKYALEAKKNKHTLVFLFQPAEEVKGGADEIVREGLLNEYNIRAAFALHIHSGLETGHVGYSEGASMAGSFYFNIALEGPGGHMASDEANKNNPILAIPKILKFFYTTLPEAITKPELSKIGVTKISSGTKSNIVPTKLEFGGSFRTLDPEAGKKFKETLANKFPGVLADTPLKVSQLNVRDGAPILLNNIELINKCVKMLEKRFKDLTFEKFEPSFYSEDFSYLSQQFASFYFSLGCQYDNNHPTFVHTPTLRIDEGAMIYGFKIFATLIGETFQ